MIIHPVRYQMFNLEFEDVEKNRMYPPGYRKESPMTELEIFTKKLRVVAVYSPATLIFLPPRNRGLPAGVYNLADLLECIALNLEGKRPLCQK